MTADSPQPGAGKPSDRPGHASHALGLILGRTATVGVIGLGYVGLPLAAATATAGFRAIGFDRDPRKVALVSRGLSDIPAVAASDLAPLVASQHLTATADPAVLGGCDVIIICVPTPLTADREPDLSFIEAAGTAVARTLRRGQTIILESTSYPGTTREVLQPILEATGYRSGEDFFLGFSPEREDPGNPHFSIATTPRVVSGDGPMAAMLVEAFYSRITGKVVPVSSMDTAEAVKITENVFRAVNIALVNELKVVFSGMGIDIWEVIEAAKTKPFGFMPFYPGPGPGGHCIPVDPFYLSWRVRELGLQTRFIDLAGEVNVAMPAYVVDRLEEGLSLHHRKEIAGSRVLVVGVAYKKNVPDLRESPSLRLIELLEARGAAVDYHDGLVPVVPESPDRPSLAGRTSVPLTAGTIARYDAVLIATDHDNVDYELIGSDARLVVDTRNALGSRAISCRRLVKA